MDGRSGAKGLQEKTIALAAVLVTLLAAGTLLSACAQQRTTSQFAVAQPAIPQKASENNPEAWLDALEQNPIDQSFVDSLAAFAYRSTASVLGDGADDAKANRMYLRSVCTTPGACERRRCGSDARRDRLGAGCAQHRRRAPAVRQPVPRADNRSFLHGRSGEFHMDGEGRSFEQSFIDTAIGQFYATPFSVEFGTDAADQAMAAWISENTGGTIDPR